MVRTAYIVKNKNQIFSINKKLQYTLQTEGEYWPFARMHGDASWSGRVRVVEQGSDVRPVQLAHFDGSRSHLIVVINWTLGPVQLPVIEQRIDVFIQYL